MTSAAIFSVVFLLATSSAYAAGVQVGGAYVPPPVGITPPALAAPPSVQSAPPPMATYETPAAPAPVWLSPQAAPRVAGHH